MLHDEPAGAIVNDDDITSICMQCGQTINLGDILLVHTDKCVEFYCSNCKWATDIADFLDNAEFKEPLGCVGCGDPIDLWEVQCQSCDLSYANSDWYEYVLYILDAGVYAKTSSWQQSLELLVNNILHKIGFRKAYENMVDILATLCYICFLDKTECTCTQAKRFTIEKMNIIPIPSLDRDFYSRREDMLDKLSVSCFNCSKQYSSQCEKLPEQLLTLDSQGRPAYKLSTCEYFEESYEQQYF